MNKKLKNAIVVAIPIVIILLIVIVSNFKQALKAIPKNPADTAGNTAGNLYNGGTFCESAGKVYFSNPYDGGSIYSMNPDQTNIKKVIGASAQYLNAAGNYLYYYSEDSAGQSGLGYIRDGRGIYRVDKAGKRNIMLANLTSDGLLLLGNTLYYTHFDVQKEKTTVSPKVTFNGMSTEGRDDTVRVNDHVKPGCTAGTSIYYAGMTGDHYLYSLDGVSGSVTKIADINMYEPTINGSTLYFLDMDDNMSLKSMPLYGGAVTTLSSERIETFNLYGEYIYYQTIDESGANDYAFKRIRTDGAGEEILRSGVVKDIQLTSTYVYFRDFNSDVPIYQIPTYGSGDVQIFQGASDAVVTP